MRNKLASIPSIFARTILTNRAEMKLTKTLLILFCIAAPLSALQGCGSSNDAQIVESEDRDDEIERARLESEGETR